VSSISCVCLNEDLLLSYAYYITCVYVNLYTYILKIMCVYVCMYIYIYRVSQEGCARLREGVPYGKVNRYNPKHLCPKSNGYGDNGQRSLKLWQLSHTSWLPNTYIKLTCEWHEAIKLSYKIAGARVIVVLRVSKHYTWYITGKQWRNTIPHSWTNIDKACQLIATVHGPARRPHFSPAVISVIVQLWT
jgi:hypothetical protein